MNTSNILKLIVDSNGWISFDNFMFEALYGKKYGYYSKSFSKDTYGPFGGKGDFITAPMMGPWLARALARNFIKLNLEAPEHLQNKLSIREIGAGTGHLAAEILVSLENSNTLPETYEIIEINQDMIRIQKKVIYEILKKNCNQSATKILNKVNWKHNSANKNNYFSCDNQSTISGMIIANELIDSFPTKIFRFVPPKVDYMAVIYECGVSADENGKLYWAERLAEDRVLHAVKKRFDQSVERGMPWNKEKFGEWCPHIDYWCNSIIRKIEWGQLFIIDYGKERFELDYPTMVESSLTAYRNHKQFNNLDECIKNPGNQDLTAQVDFSALVESFSKHNEVELEIKTQSAWLLDSGILEVAESIIFSEDQQLEEEHYRLLSSLQNLLSDSTMSESFLVLQAKKSTVHVF